MVVTELFAKLGLEVDEAAFEAAEAVIHGLHKGLLGVVGGAVAVVGGMLEMGRETANAGFEADKLAQRLGTSTDAAQELAFAAEATGSSTESLTTSMFHMSRTIEAAREGSFEAQKALSGLGVPLSDLIKMKPDEQFTKLAGGLSKTQDAGKRATKAQAIFGRGVLDLAPLMARGEEGIRGFREEAHELGVVLSKETIEEAKEWKLQQHVLASQFDALKFKVGAFVLHGLLRLSKAWTDFKKAHFEQVVNVLGTALAVLSSGMLLKYIPAALTLAKSYAIIGWEAIGAGAKAAGAFLAAQAQLALAGLGVVFFLLALNDLYHWFKGDKATLIGKIIETWKENIHSFGDAFRAVVGTLGEATNFGHWQEKGERKADEFMADQINAGVKRRRIERGVIDENGNPTFQGVAPLSPLAPGLVNPLGAFSPAALSPSGGAPLAPPASAQAMTQNNTFNVTQQKGESGEDFAKRVASMTRAAAAAHR